MLVGLVSHLVRDYNLGCSALAVSHVAILDSLFERHGMSVEYRVILPEDSEIGDYAAFTSLDGITENPSTYRTWPRLKQMVRRPRLLTTMDSFSGCDLVVDLCGGDGYTDNYGLPRLVAESVPAVVCSRSSIPMIFGPQTIGPFSTTLGRIVARNVLNRVDAVFVRDGQSLSCCRVLRIRGRVEEAIDVAFSLPFERRHQDNGLFNIGVNVSGLLYSGGYDGKNYFGLSFSYEEFVHRLIDELVSRPDTIVHLVPHVIAPDGGVDDDYAACERIRERFPSVELPERFISASAAKSYISSMDFFTGARMHATIAAISSGVPVIPVAYSRKFSGLYESLEYPYLIDAKGQISVDDAIEQFNRYLGEVEAMRKCVDRARPIYESKLADYEVQLAEAMGLTQ